MAEELSIIQQEFEKWLAEQTSPKQARVLLATQNDVELLGKRQKVLAGTLYEVTDPSQVARIRVAIESNRIFRFTYRKQFPNMIALLSAYQKYLKERPSPVEAAVSSMREETVVTAGESHTPKAEDLLTYLSQHKIFYVDNRAKGGCLWIRGGKALEPVTTECLQRFGVHFHYSTSGSKALNGAQGWWTNDGTLTKEGPSPQVEAPQHTAGVTSKVPPIIPDTWIRYDFENAEALAGTFPAYISIGGTQYSGKNWRKAVEAIVNGELKKHPAEMAVLTTRSFGNGQIPFFLQEKPTSATYIPASFQADNGYWVNAHYSIPRLIQIIHFLCAYLKYSRKDVILYGVLKSERSKQPPADSRVIVEKKLTSTGPGAPTTEERPMQKTAAADLVQKVEDVVLNADIDGISAENVASQLNASVLSTKNAVAESTRIIDINGRLIHEDALIDWDKAQKTIDGILDKLMERNRDYVSASQIYDYAHTELSMFLNDHNLDDQASVYALVQFLYGKKAYLGKQYQFSQGMHITKGKAVNSLFELAKKYSAEHDGFFSTNELADYFISLGSSNGTNLGLHMQIGREPFFFFYDEEHVISADAIGIDDGWKKRFSDCIHLLMQDVGDHIVMRDIQPAWYEMLPKLPGARPWTGVLLQNLLYFYGKDVGVHTIAAPNTRSVQYLQAMLVSDDSEIQTFCDAVAAAFIDRNLQSRRYEVEEMRALLADIGLIGPKQLIGKTAAALSGDHRFAWDADGQHVTVNI